MQPTVWRQILHNLLLHATPTAGVVGTTSSPSTATAAAAAVSLPDANLPHSMTPSHSNKKITRSITMARMLLTELHTCPRCVLRFLGVSQRSAHLAFEGVSRSSVLQVLNEIGLDAEQQLRSTSGDNERLLKRKADDDVDENLGSDSNGPSSSGSSITGQAASNANNNDSSSSPKRSRLSEPATDASSSTTTTATNDPICPSCLGLLHTPHTKLGEDALLLFKNKQYDPASRGFIVSVRVPSQIAVRQWAILRYLERRLKEEGVVGWSPPRFAERVWLRHHPRYNNNGSAGKKDGASGDAVEKGGEGEVQEDVDVKEKEEEEEEAVEEIVDVKDVLKTLIAEAFIQASGFEYDPDSPLMLDVGFDHPPTQDEFMFLCHIDRLNIKIKRKRQKDGTIHYEGNSWNRVGKACSELSFDEFVSAKRMPPSNPETHCALADFNFLHEAIYIAGRYNKYSRTISHARWLVKPPGAPGSNSEHLLYPDSVELLIAAHTDPLFLAEGHKFSSAGREDVDVLMLGRGRPFYLELLNPKRGRVLQEELSAVQELLNEREKGKIRVTDLQIVSKDSVKILKDSVATKKKSYTTLVELSTPVTLADLERVSQMTELELKQQTPTRVSERRSDMVRDKVVHSLHVYPETGMNQLDGQIKVVRVDLTTSAGTYVKEFVHSDCGRTVPSLKEMLCVSEAKVIHLDVSDVDLDWPPAVN